MRSKHGSVASVLLTSIGEATGFFEWPLTYSEAWRRKQLAGVNKRNLGNTVYRLKKKGLIKVIKRGKKQLLVLTREGQLEKLFIKAKLPQSGVWDGKWRLMVFDIPETSRDKRDQLRWLLKRNNFTKLQASVFVSPYALNREAITYLRQSGLDAYIRIIRADDIDNDADLRKRFGLKKVRFINSRP